MKLVDLAIVIPTLNEEHYIGKLLDSITSQTVLPGEIVIVDAYSQDKTNEEVKKRQKKLPQLKFYQVPKSTISAQRNYGVRKTSSPQILFLDADMFLKDSQTLEKYIREVLEKKPDVAAADNYPLSDKLFDKFIYSLTIYIFRIIKPFWPLALGMNIFVTRELFDRVGGFNERMRVSEDNEFIFKSVKKYGAKFVFLDKPKLYNSVRRLDKIGRWGYIKRSLISWWQDVLSGYKKNTTEYEFGKHIPSLKDQH